MKAPMIVPTSPPRPPTRLVPPITTAAIDGRTYWVPTTGIADPVWDAKNRPARAANNPDSP